jgi:Acetyltransferase (GNAT) family.
MALKAHGLLDDGSWIYALIDGHGHEVGAAVLVLEEQTAYFSDIWIAPHLRRRGIATALYDAVESSGIALTPSRELDEDGALFWESRLAFRTCIPGVV